VAEGRDHLVLTIIVGTPREINYWSGYANLGGNIRSGNTDQVDYTAKLGTLRRTVRNRTGFDYVGSISRIDSEDTSNNHRAAGNWDLFLSKRLFVNVANAEWYRDEFQNISNRWTVAAGIGYEIVDTPGTSWNATLGPAWQSTEYGSGAAGEDSAEGGPALRVGTRLDLDVTDDIELYFAYSAMFTSEEAGSYNHHLDTGIDFDLVGNLDFRISWIWDRVQEPRPLDDGTVPKQDDTRIVFALGWDF
jgi:putative salt-induced outer membrane protein YdiY